MNLLSKEKRANVIAALVEGSSIRSTVRMTGVAKGTVLKLLADIGNACLDYHHANVRNVKAKRVQCDEIWSFCHSKEANIPLERKADKSIGSIWTWTAIDADSKLCIAYTVGGRD